MLGLERWARVQSKQWIGKEFWAERTARVKAKEHENAWCDQVMKIEPGVKGLVCWFRVWISSYGHREALKYWSRDRAYSHLYFLNVVLFKVWMDGRRLGKQEGGHSKSQGARQCRFKLGQQHWKGEKKDITHRYCRGTNQQDLGCSWGDGSEGEWNESEMTLKSLVNQSNMLVERKNEFT